MPDSTATERLLEVLSQLDVQADDLAAVETALTAAPELLPIFRTAWKAPNPALESCWPWMEKFIALFNSRADLDSVRKRVFRVLLIVHNAHAQHPIVLSHEERGQAVTR